jgi:hypothetical protein
MGISGVGKGRVAIQFANANYQNFQCLRALKRIKVGIAASGLLPGQVKRLAVSGTAACGESKAGDVPMSELENKLNHILEEHQHESGLHMIGGRRRLIDRLVKFFEEDLKTQEKKAPAGSRDN